MQLLSSVAEGRDKITVDANGNKSKHISKLSLVQNNAIDLNSVRLSISIARESIYMFIEGEFTESHLSINQSEDFFFRGE